MLTCFGIRLSAMDEKPVSSDQEPIPDDILGYSKDKDVTWVSLTGLLLYTARQIAYGNAARRGKRQQIATVNPNR